MRPLGEIVDGVMSGVNVRGVGAPRRQLVLVAGTDREINPGQPRGRRQDGEEDRPVALVLIRGGRA